MAKEDPKLNFEKGDIIFYRTNTAATFFDLDPGEFDDFRVLSAFGQALPYVVQPDGNQWSPHPQHFRPWHHVAIAVSDTEVVEFVQQVANGESGDEEKDDDKGIEINWQSVIQKRAFEEAENECADVMRLAADSGVGYNANDVETAAKDQADKGAKYASDGLAAFAVATFARLLPQGPDRELALNVAYGMNKVVRDRGTEEETCVTAAAKAIAEGLDAPLTFAEPAAPPKCQAEKYFAYEDSPVQRMIGMIQKETDKAGVVAALENLSVAAVLDTDFGISDLLLRQPPIEWTANNFPNGTIEILNRDGDKVALDANVTELFGPISDLGNLAKLGAGGVHYDPDDFSNAGTVVATMDFVPALEIAFKSVAADNTTDLVASGEAARKNDPLDASNLAVSPAMLFDALWNLGFRRVEHSCGFDNDEAESGESND